MTHCRTFPPPPPEFLREFAKGGWERVELLYGARTDVICKWIHLTGAKCRFPKKGIASNIGLKNAI